MKTGVHPGGRPIYGPRPSFEAMVARSHRERFDAVLLIPCIVTRRGAGTGYWVEGWALPEDSYRKGMRFYHVYTLRRDGKIERSWSPVEANRVEFHGPNVRGTE